MSKLFKRTKILATIGPAVASAEQIEQIIMAGVNGCRLNFSHGTYDQMAQFMTWIRQAAAKKGRSVAILQDLQGPKIRLGDLKDNHFDVHEGDELVLDYSVKEHDGSATLPIQYNLAPKVKVGEPIYLFDGKIRTHVAEIVSDTAIKLIAENDGFLMSHKGLNLPDTDFGGDILTEKDLHDIEFGAQHDFDFVALSFVQSAADIEKLRSLLKNYGSEARIIAKIETKKAIETEESLEAIVKAADGEVIMDLFPISYRGDSGVEMRNPVGCYSKQLSSTYNFILCEHMAKDRLRRVFLDAGIKIKGMFANAAVVADSVVSTDEKDEGVAVVDIGGGVTDVAIYYGGALRHIVSIPIGGTAVNGDIRAYGIPEKQVEKLKTRYGSAVVDLTPDDIIQVRNSSRSLKSILRLNLAAVIEARMTDIAEYVWNEIREAGFAKKLSAGIVLTGGGAALKNADELFHRVTGQDVRVACAEMGVATESLERVASPAFTLAVSILIDGAQVGPCPVGNVRAEEPERKPVRAVEKTAENPVAAADAAKAHVAGTGAVAGAAAGMAGAAAAAKSDPAEIPADPVSEDYDDDDDIDSNEGGWFSRLREKARRAFDEAFKNPDESDDGDDY